MPEPVWYELRSLRSRAVGLAARDGRRHALFVAALEQFEELLKASAGLSPASRPLTAYYALAQAGKAIVAAHSTTGPARSHGLAMADPVPGRDLMTTPLQASGDGWYQLVSATVGSPTLLKAELGQIWAAIPDLAYTPLPFGSWAKAARVYPVEGKFAFAPAKTAVADVVLNPAPANPQEAANRLKAYPTEARKKVALVPGLDPAALISTVTERGIGFRVTFSIPETHEAIPQPSIVTRQAPEYRFAGQHWLIPALDEGQVLSPLMLWWALLFALSMLARYHPEAWVSALDVNHSQLAVPLEDALEAAQTAVPHLVLEALIREHIRLH